MQTMIPSVESQVLPGAVVGTHLLVRSHFEYSVSQGVRCWSRGQKWRKERRRCRLIVARE